MNYFLSINKSESISNISLLLSCTRQNSTNETAQLSTTNTNQQYLTVDLINDNDLDTDNDQSQTIQYKSEHNTRLISETDVTSTIITIINDELLPSIDSNKHDETIIEIPIDTNCTNDKCIFSYSIFCFFCLNS